MVHLRIGILSDVASVKNVVMTSDKGHFPWMHCTQPNDRQGPIHKLTTGTFSVRTAPTPLTSGGHAYTHTHTHTHTVSICIKKHG